MKEVVLGFGIFLFALLSACNQYPQDLSISEPENQSFILQNKEGEQIKTGQPYSFVGSLIPDSNVSITSTTLTSLHTFPEPLLKSYLHPKSKTLSFSTKPREIRFGKGNFDPITTIKIGTPKKIHIDPIISQALPFQNEIHEKLSYKTLGVSQGLKSTFVSSVFQDSRGYFWLGSRRGLTKYDSYSFQYYPFVRDGQRKEISAINEDKKGNIWLSFGSLGGLVKFDGKDFYEYTEGAGLSIGEDYLGIIHCDKKGNIWLKSETKIIRFDGKTFTCFPYQFQNLKNLNIIIRENAQGNFWLSALGGVCQISGNTMNYYPIEGRGENNLCHPIMEDDRGLIIATGTSIALLKNNSLSIFPSSFIRDHEIRNALSIGNDFILAAEDKHNAICSLQDDVLTVIAENAPLFTGAEPLFVDRFNTIWFNASSSGVQVYNPQGFNHFKFEALNKGGHISALIEDRNGNTWFGSHGFGLYKFDGENHSYYSLGENKSGIAIRSLLEDRQGNIWAGTVHEGLFKIENAQSNQPTVTQYNCFPDSSFSVFSLTEDLKGNIWIGTRTRGILKFDGKNFTQYAVPQKDPINSANNIRTLITDRKGTIWAGAQDGGVRKFDGKKWTWYSEKEGLSSNHVVSLLEDSKGIIWIGTTDQGVDKFDGKTFTNISVEDGLTSNAIWTITEDADQNIWLGADICLNVLLQKSGSTEVKVKTYCNLDGLEGAEFYANATMLDRNNKLWWGTDQMAVMTPNPGSLANKGDALISLEEINVVNNRVDFKQLKDSIAQGKTWKINAEQHIDLSTLIFDDVAPFANYPIHLRVPAQLNDLTFVFSVSETVDPSNIEFSYFMEGIDKDWSLPTRVNRIDYRSLKAGKYTLKARVSEIKGLWSEPYEYSFIVLPYWWQTWWANCIWFALFVLLILSGYHLLTIRKREKEDAQRIKEMEAMKSRLYSNITHEFRTPLTLIMGMNDQISNHEKETTIIKRNSEKLLLQVNQLLDAAKFESGNLQLSLVQSDIVHYLRFLTESFYVLATDKNIQLTFYSEEDELFMDYDEEKIQAVVYNLLSNAIKFTPNDGAIIFHVSVLSEKKQPLLRLKVKDTGVGISESDLPKIFERFYQATNKTKIGEGTGIGLSLTRDLIHLMDGEIAVESEITKGSEFIVTLPIRTNAEKVSQKEFAQPIGMIGKGTESMTLEGNDPSEKDDKKHVLIVEDNPEIAQFLAEILRSTYVIHIAENGKLGLEKAIELIPDAIISDITMPEMDGFELCETVKKDQRTSHIPIILLTAKTTQSDRIDGLKLGADAYLTKPFNREELEVRLEKLIELRKKLQKYYAALLAQTAPTQDHLRGNEINPTEESFLQKLIEIAEEHYADSEFGVPELATHMNVSQMQVYRKLKALTDKTPSQFIRSIRLQKAMELITQGELTISEIAYSVGFSDPNYFSKTFHKKFGNPPIHFRK